MVNFRWTPTLLAPLQRDKSLPKVRVESNAVIRRAVSRHLDASAA